MLRPLDPLRQFLELLRAPVTMWTVAAMTLLEAARILAVVKFVTSRNLKALGYAITSLPILQGLAFLFVSFVLARRLASDGVVLKPRWVPWLVGSLARGLLFILGARAITLALKASIGKASLVFAFAAGMISWSVLLLPFSIGLVGLAVGLSGPNLRSLIGQLRANLVVLLLCYGALVLATTALQILVQSQIVPRWGISGAAWATAAISPMRYAIELLYPIAAFRLVSPAIERGIDAVFD